MAWSCTHHPASAKGESRVRERRGHAGACAWPAWLQLAGEMRRCNNNLRRPLEIELTIARAGNTRIMSPARLGRSARHLHPAPSATSLPLPRPAPHIQYKSIRARRFTCCRPSPSSLQGESVRSCAAGCCADSLDSTASTDRADPLEGLTIASPQRRAALPPPPNTADPDPDPATTLHPKRPAHSSRRPLPRTHTQARKSNNTSPPYQAIPPATKTTSLSSCLSQAVNASQGLDRACPTSARPAQLLVQSWHYQLLSECVLKCAALAEEAYTYTTDISRTPNKPCAAATQNVYLARHSVRHLLLRIMRTLLRCINTQTKKTTSRSRFAHAHRTRGGTPQLPGASCSRLSQSQLAG